MIGLESHVEGEQIVVSPSSRRVSLSCLKAQRSALYITSCYSFRYDNQLIAQLVERREDLSHPENSCLPRAT